MISREPHKTSQTPSSEKKRTTTSSFRGSAVQRKIGRATTTRSTRPTNRGNPAKKGVRPAGRAAPKTAGSARSPY